MSHNTITSLQSLQSTLETDSHVFRWFLYLITQQGVKSALAVDKNIHEYYESLKRTVSLERILCVILLSVLLFAYFSKQYQIFFPGAILLCICVNLHRKAKNLITRISIHLISQDFEQANFSQLTLYQIGEFYGRKYQVKPFVMMMTSADEIVRRMALAAWVFGTFIMPLSFFGFWGSLLGTYFITTAIIHTSLIYNRLK